MCEVARRAVARGEAVEPVGQHLQLARERVLEDEPLVAVDELLVRRGVAGELAVDAVERGGVTRVHEQLARHVQEVVPARAVAGPVPRPAAPRWPKSSRRPRTAATRRTRGRDQSRRGVRARPVRAIRHRRRTRYPPTRSASLRREHVMVLQPAEVAGGVVHAVGVVDPQPQHLAARDQLEREAVGGGEHFLTLHREGGEVVNVEEAAVVDLVRRVAPVREAVVLRRQQRVEPVEAAASPGVPLRAARSSGRRSATLWGERELAVVVADEEFAVLVNNIEFALFQHLRIVIAERGDQHLVVKLRSAANRARRCRSVGRTGRWGRSPARRSTTRFRSWRRRRGWGRCRARGSCRGRSRRRSTRRTRLACRPRG